MSAPNRSCTVVVEAPSPACFPARLVVAGGPDRACDVYARERAVDASPPCDCHSILSNKWIRRKNLEVQLNRGDE
jgi:hypothetical protein